MIPRRESTRKNTSTLPSEALRCSGDLGLSTTETFLCKLHKTKHNQDKSQLCGVKLSGISLCTYPTNAPKRFTGTNYHLLCHPPTSIIVLKFKMTAKCFQKVLYNHIRLSFFLFSLLPWSHTSVLRQFLFRGYSFFKYYLGSEYGSAVRQGPPCSLTTA